MKKYLIIGFVLLISCNDKKIEALERKVDSLEIGNQLVLQSYCGNVETNARQDSAIEFLIYHAQHSDSVAIVKQTKGDRAEKRGKFLGGILKVLIPGL